MHYGVDTLPFGGIGHSGTGSYRYFLTFLQQTHYFFVFSGRYGYEEFSHSKAVLVRGFFGDGLAR